MDFLSIFIISVGLAMDSLAVCISQSMCRIRFFFIRSLKIAFVFGLFQGGMPLIGFFLGKGFSRWIEQYDHWFAFGILLILGVHMLFESFGKKTDKDECQCVCDEQQDEAIEWKKVIALSFATSIDALVSGIIFVPYPAILFKALVTIGLVTLILSLLGMYTGISFGRKISFDTSLLGGIMLIGIGTKILLEHTL
jgi:putative Mn2+ efflux pump MntP